MKFRNTHYLLACGMALALTASFGLAAANAQNANPNTDKAVIEQSRGVDSGVDYASLVRFGPWDDRNYELTVADVALLPANDRFVPGVPAFFKVLKRKEMAAEGFPIGEFYPREVDKEFAMRFGGLMQNGKLNRTGLGIYSHPDPQNPPKPLIYATDPLPHAVPVEGEGPMAQGDNETGIEFNPVDPNIVIAGSNGPGGQDMNYSTDGGVTWFHGGSLPNSCCDPASDWSSDGTVAYTATLAGSGGWRTVVHRSTNNGQNWAPGVIVSSGSSDKEYIHVDKSPTSPYLDNVYVTWHQGNVMHFARSTDRALTFQTPLVFSSAPTGIGSDITTDASGRIYYAWPSLTSSAIQVATSTDGGISFNPPVMAYDLHGRFDFAIPSMESRRAFIYVSADVDQSGGAHDGRVYLAFTDEAPNSPGGGGGSASASHGWVQVIHSDDQGATWQVAATPHSTSDQATVDRYHPWLDVDNNGIVHIGFYDTRNSPNRTGVDFYYVYSADGGATWIDETRVSQVVSQNINNGQEWGDYNGLSVSMANVVAMTWTDNRNTGGGAVQSSYVGRVTNVAGGPSYILGLDGANSYSVCAGTPVDPITLTARAFGGFNAPVTLSFPGIDSTVFPSATVSPNPITPADPVANGTINLTTAAGATTGTYGITVSGTDGAAEPLVRSVAFDVTVAAGIPGAATLSAPANGATDVARQPVFSWSADPAAVSYTVEVATDASFTNIVATGTPTEATWTPETPLAPMTAYHWRVRSNSPCGDSAFSAVFSFTTGVTFPEPYCPVTFPQNVEPITHVVYAGIDNTTSATLNGTPALEDFTGIIGTVAPGSSSSMAVEGNTDGSFSTTVTTYIDWNQDGDFTDSGETYPIGTIVGSTGTDGEQAVANIAVPAGALTGTTRMRVTKKFNGAAPPCNNSGYGQAEDYTLNVGSGGPTYSVGGTLSGLAGSGLELSLNSGAQTLPLVANGVFTFPGELANGAAYAVTVATQPGTPAQTCTVSNGSGTIAGADVTNVAVTCTTGGTDLIFEDGFDGEPVVSCEPAQLLQDTSFEASLAGGPWSSTSTNFGTGMCDEASCGLGGGSAGPLTGAAWVWMGGIAASETTTASQAVVIPTGSDRFLNFNLWIGSVNGGATNMDVLIDSDVVASFPEPAVAEAAYSARSVDVSSYADGASHTVLFRYVSTGDASNYSLDDVTLDCTALPAGPIVPAPNAPNGAAAQRIAR